MKAWLVLLGILLAGGAAFLLLSTTTSTVSHAVDVRGCGVGAYSVSSADLVGEPEAAWTYEVEPGEEVLVTIPAGEFRVQLDASPGVVRGLDASYGAVNSLLIGGCASEPTAERFVVEGSTSLRVAQWILGPA